MRRNLISVCQVMNDEDKSKLPSLCKFLKCFHIADRLCDILKLKVHANKVIG